VCAYITKRQQKLNPNEQTTERDSEDLYVSFKLLMEWNGIKDTQPFSSYSSLQEPGITTNN
jgi:hypothetical protein